MERSQEAEWMKVRTLHGMTAVKPGLTGIIPRLANWQAHRKLERMKVRTLHGMTAVKPGLTGTVPRFANWRDHKKLKWMKVRTLHGMTAVKPGLTGIMPVAVKLSPAQLKLAFMRRYTQSGLTDPRK